MTERILVTGMSGLIGGVVRAELEGDYALSALNRSDVAGVQTWRADLADLDAIRPAFEGQDAVVHLAAKSGEQFSWEEFRDTNHHCYAWREAERFRYSDDGEPSGSAGKPILQQIDGGGLDRIAVVVTRIFGGTKLGVGGLIRAYGAAVRELLDRADIAEVVPYRIVAVTIPYELSGGVASVANTFGVEASDSDFGERSSQTYQVALDRVDAFVAALTNQTAGRAEIAVTKPGEQRP